MWSWSRWWQPGQGAAKLWIVALVFIVVGALIAFGVPGIVAPNTADRDTVILIVRALGGIFIFIGLAVFVPMLASLYVKQTSPENEAVVHWWANFLGGLLGALIFGIPATLMFPIFLVAYFLRPNFLFANELVVVNNLLISALFSVIGLGVDVALFFIARSKHRERPRWKG